MTYYPTDNECDAAQIATEEYIFGHRTSTDRDLGITRGAMRAALIAAHEHRGMSDYTPTENEIAEAYNRDAANVAVRFGVLINEAVEKSEAEVRRALAKMKARAWDEGHAAGMDEGHGATIIETNPYKEAE